jgi:hypothetical protein
MKKSAIGRKILPAMIRSFRNHACLLPLRLGKKEVERHLKMHPSGLEVKNARMSMQRLYNEPHAKQPAFKRVSSSFGLFRPKKEKIPPNRQPFCSSTCRPVSCRFVVIRAKRRTGISSQFCRRTWSAKQPATPACLQGFAAPESGQNISCLPFQARGSFTGMASINQPLSAQPMRIAQSTPSLSLA